MFGLIKPQFQYLLHVVVVGLLFSCSVESMRFDLQSNLARCFAQELNKGTLTYANYTLINPNDSHPLPHSYNFTVQVRMKDDNTLLHLGEQVQSGQFSFTTYKEGDYMVCFWGQDHFTPPVTFPIHFDWKTGVRVAPNHWSKVAKKTDLDIMAIELQMMHDTVLSIQEEMSYLRERDYERQVLNWSTNDRMLWMSLVSFFVCFSVAGVQLWHLKTFFKKNKIL